ncbi:MAG: 16S rRNA (guanine(966)-N(2))-methyltransferase RsmD [Chlamydiales bacterium]
MTLKIIAGKWKGRALKTPKGGSTRPTQGMLREAIFNICQNEVGGARFLDLFAGSGAMGLEALSRGAAHATFIEQNRQAIACIKENIGILKGEAETSIVGMEASRAVELLARQKALFDLIYIDPPYDIGFDIKPAAQLLAPGGTLFLEERRHPKRGRPTAGIGTLQCKETRRFGAALITLFQNQCSDSR